MKKRWERWLAAFLSLTLILGVFTGVPAPAAAEEAGTVKIENVAPYGTAYADSEYGSYAKENLNDGNESTLWISGKMDPPVSCGVKLDHTYDVYGVKVVFEKRDSSEQVLRFHAEYLDPETKEYVKLWEGRNYDEEKETFTNEITLETPVKTSDIRVTITARENTAAWPAIMEIEVFADDRFEHAEKTNVALNKPIEVSAGGSGSVINDGNKGNYWDGGVAPAEFEIDLGTGHFISEFVATTYYGDGRYYHYEIWTSLDGRNYTKSAEKSDNTPATASGTAFTFDTPLNIRYIRVVMTLNSANPSVHMREFEAYGVPDPDYTEPEIPDYDTRDPDNIAFGKPARSNLNSEKVANVTDGMDITYWTGEFYPSYVDVDLMEEYDLSEIILNFPVREGRYYYYTVYGSNDCSSYDRLYQKRTKAEAADEGDLINAEGRTYRFIRVYIEYCSDAGSARLSEVRVHGEPTDRNKEALRTGKIEDVLSIQPYSETEYAKAITEEETIENVYGIIDRTVGRQYRSWFAFAIAENEESTSDYYTLTDKDGKVFITGNDGISLAAGVNYYYKNYCNVNISEQASQTRMPAAVVPVNGTVRRETPYEIRYAFNYCTLDYTFAFFGEEDFQKEYDWLALNGVNVVLDLAGQEAVWIKFLMNFGYSFDEAKDWISGPSYYAWQFMDNMEIFGGPVSDGWVKDRLNMARKNQRWKNSLGMQTVLQGYAGMVPTNFSEYQDVDILKQGGWCGLNRPDMIRTDGELYDTYADLFYKAQEWAFGATSDYYAADPFHEGGIRPSDLSDSTIAAEVLDSLLKYDKDAVWMVQAWWSNPTNELLKGMGEYRQDHVIILDLTGLEAPKWNGTAYGNTTLDAKEFNGTDWVWCMLENYGGNPSMDGQIQKMARDIPNAYKTAEHMKGIGIIPEATFDNPVIYDLIFDMAWVTEEVDIDAWLDDYVIRRYGAESDSARRAWDLLKRTIYNRSGNTAYTLARLPEGVGAQSLPYNGQTVEKAFKLLLEDFDTLSESEGYLYDLTELMRQLVNNYGVVQYRKVLEAFHAGELETFRTEKEAFLNAFDVCDLVQGTQKEQLVGEWIGKAEDWAANYDDFSYDSLTMNAKALITTWAGAASASALPDYAYRNYQGMMTDLYKARWETFLDKEETFLTDGTAVDRLGQGDYFHFYWNWVMNTPEYTREADNSPAHIWEVAQRLLAECSVIEEDPVNEGNLAMDKKIWANDEVNSPGSGGGYASHANDGSLDTYWDGGEWEKSPWIIVDLGKEYDLGKINIVPYYAGTRYYLYRLYTSTDGEDWELLAEKTSTAAGTAAGDVYNIGKRKARYIKLVGTYNSANEAFHIKEIRAYECNLAGVAEVTELIEALEALDMSSYTEASAAAVSKAVRAAKEALGSADVTQAEIDEVLANLKEAKAFVDAEKLMMDFVQKAEEAKEAAQTAGQAAAEARGAAEGAQREANEAQKAALQAKTEAESAKREAEDAKKEAEDARAKAVEAKNKAEEASKGAAAFESGAKEAQAAAVAAKTAAETAEANAKAAQTAADNAQKKADDAQGKALTAQGKAEAARDQAAKSESAANAAKTAAENAKTAAEQSKGDALAAAAAVQAALEDANRAKADAVTAKENAETARGEATASKTAAIAAKEEAIQAKADAQAFVTAAENAKASAEAARDAAVQILKSAQEISKKAQDEIAAKLAEADAKLKAAEETKEKIETLVEKSLFKKAKVSVKAIKNGAKKQAKVTWKAVGDAEGYVIWYGTKASMKGAKTVTVKSGEKTNGTVKNLKRNKKYYFRMRAYRTIDGEKVYTKYSAKKSLKVK